MNMDEQKQAPMLFFGDNTVFQTFFGTCMYV